MLNIYYKKCRMYNVENRSSISHALSMRARPPAPKSRLPAPITTALGQRIKQRRHEIGKSQETLAFESRVDRTYISAMERGIANPSIETLANICYSLEITLAALFEPLDHVHLKPTGARRANAATPPEIKRQRLR